MGSHKIISSLALFCFIIMLTTFCPTKAQNSQQEYLDTHNAARAQVGVGPLTWDDNVAAYAQSYANERMNDCNLMHSGGQYGENLAASSGGEITATDAVNMWVNEKSNYDYSTNSCVGGVCGHYTQVVWANSVRLGCASVPCANNGGSFVICNYDPPGNFVGQRPY
ncbi:hypothetical protein ACH5RR_002124 [Cinchona calisaya]|uniref:SCP domain-containing protein n=1 Tax=Cinchona calisaya TaxID=153742 RepID=A0ABD3B694_9GENT